MSKDEVRMPVSRSTEEVLFDVIEELKKVAVEAGIYHSGVPWAEDTLSRLTKLQHDLKIK